MKTRILPILILFITQLAFSQVGIGTTNPSSSSALEIRSNNSGLLIPRISLISTTDNTTIASPATSLLVYNTSSSNDVTPGFYYWEGSWKSLKSTASAASTSGWSLTGNTTTPTDYLGTNNYNSLVFKVNNSPFSKYHPNGGITIGASANANDNSSVAIGTSANASANNQATAIGPNTLASGFQSTALGYLATASNNNAIAMGLSSNSSGFQSIGIGNSAVSNNNNSLAFGNSSNASGQQSTAIGTSASSTAQNATAIGYQATATQANSIILGSSANANNKIGIGTNTPDERLHVAGSIKIVDGSQGLGKVLTSDANGKATWQTPTVVKAYADIYLGGTTVQLLSNNNNINFGSTNVFSNVVVSGNSLKVSIAGKYKISYKVTYFKGTNDREFKFNLYKSNTIIPGSLTNTGDVGLTDNIDESKTIGGSVIVSLAANDEIFVKGTSSDNNNSRNINLVPNGCSLSVELLD